MSDSIFYANDSAHGQVDAHGDAHVIFYGSSKHGYGDAQQRAILPRRVAEQMLSRLAAALAPVNSAEPPAQEEPPMPEEGPEPPIEAKEPEHASFGDFGAEHEQPNTATGEWRERFGVQS